jgi:hypothetical protein
MKRFFIVLAALVLVVGLAGCINSAEDKAKKAITAKLTDPTSPLFSDFTELKTLPEVPGWAIMRAKVNAKNSKVGWVERSETHQSQPITTRFQCRLSHAPGSRTPGFFRRRMAFGVTSTSSSSLM